MISEESCDTEDWSRTNDAENTALITEKNIYLNVKPGVIKLDPGGPVSCRV